MENSKFEFWKPYLFYIIGFVFVTFLLFEFEPFIDAFLGAIILYVLSKPLMNRLIRKKWKKGLAAVTIMVCSFLIILLPILGFSYMFISKMTTIFSESSFFIQTINSIDDKFRELTGIELLSQENILAMQNKATEFITQFLGESVSVLADIGVMYFLLYYMLVNTGRLENAFNEYLPISKENIGLLSGELKSQTYSNAMGAPLLALTQGVFAWFGYLIFGLSDPFFWGIMTGFFSFAPLVGSTLICIPAGLYQLTVGTTWQGVGILLYGILVIGTVDNVFRFVFQKQFADVHPLTTVFGIILGLQMFGVPGIIFGPLLLSWFVILIRIYRKDFSVIKTEKEHPRTSSS